MYEFMVMFLDALDFIGRTQRQHDMLPLSAQKLALVIDILALT